MRNPSNFWVRLSLVDTYIELKNFTKAKEALKLARPFASEQQNGWLENREDEMGRSYYCASP